MPIVDARIKKYFPETESTMSTTIQQDNVLLQTIKITNNLFSVTERLPKPKYKRSHGNYSTMS
jgi:hypothetical protein